MKNNNEEQYAFLNLPSLPSRLNATQVGWYLGFKTHEISILVGVGLLKPIGNPSANTPKFFTTESITALHDDGKWLGKATDTVYAYWRRKNGQKRAGRNGRTSPSSRASGV